MAGKRKSKALKGSKTADSEQVAVATARTLAIPELLYIIFSFSDAPELARSARVCKNWSDRALDELWRDLDSVFPLLELLMDSELVRAASRDSADLEVVSSALANADWPRFHSYAKRVQFFHFDNLDTPLLEYGLMGSICLHHPYGPSLLPRLRRLDWSTGWSALLMIPFLSEDSTHLNLELYSASDAQIKETFNALRNRTLKLRTFRLDTKAFGAASESALALWLEKMETLEILNLPPYYLSARILATIRTFPRLEIIDITNIKSCYQYNDAGFPAAIPDGSFPSLVGFGLPVTPAAAQHLLFNSHTNFTGLTALRLHAPKDIKANQILSFTQQLAGHCPMINTIDLAFFLGPDFRSQGAAVLPIEILESLYPCKNINALAIGNPLPLKLSPVDVGRDNMARAWPRIRHLCLCSEPDFSFYVSEQMGNSLSIISVFASYLPHLLTLGLYFNGQDRVAFKGHLYPRYQFTQLLTLLVGLSPIPKTHTCDLGFYLASLCSETVGVGYGRRTWREVTMPSDTAEREKAWEDVGESMAFAMRVKLAGQN
ncbi:hypothetical protein M407DRAFT_18698 [Tulasnella calospora MUT 4182]|uniref:F-box domain-containing protein n=1 Tax=Tulasnella calospora MUT 4182 TaxID=1051891 RepID=A0A0C3MF87_9AGAM|nr:hypothetical protein M407DRAFT_18698 [Tulasnella calospora MUT 4182]